MFDNNYFVIFNKPLLSILTIENLDKLTGIQGQQPRTVGTTISIFYLI